MLGASFDTYCEWLCRLPEEQIELRSLDAQFFLDFLLDGGNTFYYVSTTQLPSIAVRELLLQQLLERLERDQNLVRLNPEKLRWADYPSDAALMMRRLLESDAPLRSGTFRWRIHHHTQFLLLEAARLAGRGAEFLALRHKLVGYGFSEVSETSLSVLQGLRRCGWRFWPHDSDIVKALAWWPEEAQNWRESLEDGSYEEDKCHKIIERYEQRLAFFHEWEGAMRREARALARILAGASLNGSGRLPQLVAHRIAAFAVWELAAGAAEAAEAWPEPAEGAAHDMEDVDQRESVIDETIHEERVTPGRNHDNIDLMQQRYNSVIEPAVHSIDGSAEQDPDLVHSQTEMEETPIFDNFSYADRHGDKNPQQRQQQENEDVLVALQRSKGDAPPLNSDGVVLLRLTRNARFKEVTDLLLDATGALSECHTRVAEAGCEVNPPWACGAHLFVPCTEQQFSELHALGFELMDYHILALSSDKDIIEKALQALPRKRRPRVSSERQGAQAFCPHVELAAKRADIESDDDGFDRNDVEPMVVVEQSLATNSDVGFPVWHAAGFDAVSPLATKASGSSP